MSALTNPIDHFTRGSMSANKARKVNKAKVKKAKRLERRESASRSHIHSPPSRNINLKMICTLKYLPQSQGFQAHPSLPHPSSLHCSNPSRQCSLRQHPAPASCGLLGARLLSPRCTCQFQQLQVGLLCPLAPGELLGTRPPKPCPQDSAVQHRQRPSPCGKGE